MGTSLSAPEEVFVPRDTFPFEQLPVELQYKIIVEHCSESAQYAFYLTTSYHWHGDAANPARPCYARKLKSDNVIKEIQEHLGVHHGIDRLMIELATYLLLE